jgi:hypothetical protein
MPILKDLDVHFVSLVDRAAVRDPSNPTEAQRFLLFKKESGAPNTDSPEGGSMTEAELTAALQKAEQERDELAAKVEKLEKKLAKKDKDEKPAEVNKAELPAEVREALEKAEAERDALKKSAEEAAELAKAERDLRVTREFVAKAEAEFPHVAQGADEFGPLLKSMSEKLSEEEFEAVTKRFRAANEQIKTSNLLKQFGQDGEPPAGDDELASAVQKAEEMRKADPNLSLYDAMTQAMTREQQAAYLASVRG